MARGHESHIPEIWNWVGNQKQIMERVMKNILLTLITAFAGFYFIAADSASAQRLTFAATTYVSGDNVGVMDPTCLVATDINGDGKPDLISVNGGGTQLTTVTNDGYGNFGSNALINVG